MGENQGCNQPGTRDTDRSEWAGLSILPKDLQLSPADPDRALCPAPAFQGENAVRHHQGGSTAGQVKKAFKKKKQQQTQYLGIFLPATHNGQEESGKKKNQSTGPKNHEKESIDRPDGFVVKCTREEMPFLRLPFFAILVPAPFL